MTCFTKGRFGLTKDPPAALLQDPSLSVLPQNFPFVRPIRVVSKDEIGL